MSAPKDERQAGRPGAQCAGANCGFDNFNPTPRKNQARLHPMARIALQNLQFDLEAIPNRTGTEESGLKAAAYLLANF